MLAVAGIAGAGRRHYAPRQGRPRGRSWRCVTLTPHYNFQLTGHIRMTDKVQRLMPADMLQLEHAPRLALTTGTRRQRPTSWAYSE
ncbi:hypothetical protein EVAR_83188_1 [Eumeta japonica]|uniref:Uncharacterized protein n=1 Tax=Eumeta variegata TaxID=151549 RepID=A0A4C1YRY7_EUMVA|nr:hypothetical protein EVAR_83188_1 [Eumeta japonica]